MAIISQDGQTALIIESLNYDKACNYSRLEYYLKQILAGHEVTFETRSGTPFTVSAQKAWDLIHAWGQTESTGLPVGDRGSRKTLASRLLNYIQTNISGNAEANYHAMLEQAKLDDKINPITTAPANNFTAKALALRNTQLKLMQNNLYGKLITNLEKTKLLQNADPTSRILILQMIAANHASFRELSEFTPEKMNQILIHQAEPGVNNFIHHLYTKNALDRDQTSGRFTGELVELRDVIDQTVKSAYPNKEKEYLSDMAQMRQLSALAPNLGDVSWMVEGVINATTGDSKAERARFIKLLQSQTIASARGQHVTGDEIIKSALKQAGLGDISFKKLNGLIPYLEEIEVKTREKLFGSELSDRDSRQLSTYGLATKLGIDPTIPWLQQKDLAKATQAILQEYRVSSLEEAFARAYGNGENVDLEKLVAIKDLLSKTLSHDEYKKALDGSLRLRMEDGISKGLGNYTAYRQPYDRFTQKLWKGYEKIDDIINWPTRTIADGWEKILERYPLLDPVGYIFKKWHIFESNIALKIHGWALEANKAGGWFGGFAGQIADFSEGFIKHDADWTRAGSFFLERKWGNVLDWGSKKIFSGKNFLAVKTEFWTKIATSAGNIAGKIAPGLAEKVSASILTAVGLATSEVGVGFLLLGAQILWEAGKGALTKIKELFGNIINGNADNFFGAGLIWAAGVFATINGIFLGIPGALAGLMIVLRSIVKFVWESLTALFILAGGIGLVILTFFALFYFIILTPSFQLDSGVASKIISSLICSEGGNGNACADKAVCLAKYLNECYGSSVTSSDFGTGETSLQCVLAKGIDAAAGNQIYRSAIGFTNLQCVGFAQAVQTMCGNSLEGKNACNYVSGAAGYEFISGLAGVKPGDPVIIGSNNCTDGSPGHIAIFLQDAGALITVADANQVCPGCVKGDNKLPVSIISGYLKKL